MATPSPILSPYTSLPNYETLITTSNDLPLADKTRTWISNNSNTMKGLTALVAIVTTVGLCIIFVCLTGDLTAGDPNPEPRCSPSVKTTGLVLGGTATTAWITGAVIIKKCLKAQS